MYPVETLQLSERREDDLEDLPERFKLLAGLEAKFGKGYHDMLVENGYDKQFVRAYLASVTFADEQVGRILDAWYASPHAGTGYVVLWSDHGYMLGEKSAWSKIKPWYDSSRSNFMIAGPAPGRCAEKRFHCWTYIDSSSCWVCQSTPDPRW